MKPILAAGLLALAALHAQEFTRGVGIYPGDPKADFGPVMQVDASTYRNLALHRPAYHSSSYDYNLTAQLVTDGIIDARMPRWVAVATSQQGSLAKNEREVLLDGNWVTDVSLKGPRAWVEIEIGGDEQPAVDRVDVDARVLAEGEPENWALVVWASDDAEHWIKAGSAEGMSRPDGEIRTSVKLDRAFRNHLYRVNFEDHRATRWQVSEVQFFHGNERLAVGGPGDFTSAWMPAGKGEEWVYVDLGAGCTFDRVKLYWIRRAAEGSLDVSDDATHWKLIQALPATSDLTDDLKLAQPVAGRYVRVRMTNPASPEGYVLSEVEVYGRGGPVAHPKPAPAPRADGKLELAGGGWRLQRGSLVTAAGETISKSGFADEGWIVATVPGTVLTSYYNVGAIPDPNFGDNQLMISDSFFCADFWYRNEFVPPAAGPGQHVWLNFDGINWKADIFLNGEKLGRIEGGFMRGRFDVTRLLHPGEKNALAVRIEKTATPGSVKEKTYENPDKNGGALGADNPTYHATIGWDWIPTMRGRDTGIWKDVYLAVSGPVTIESPFVASSMSLPDTSRADVSVTVTLRNYETRAVNGTLRGRFGDVRFETPVALDPSAEKTVKLDPSTNATLRLQNPKLWWPTGYGDPNLYPVELKFETADGKTSDSTAFQAGIRQFTYSENGGVLKMWVNGRRFIPRGGNWGFGESMLRYRAREYDAAVRYHRDMNLNMIRDWVGQIGDDEFYEACDRHGIVVWQDFWLANPWDGPDPDDDGMFLRNVQDYVLRIRNHPSIGLYCGRNEGYPPWTVDAGIRQTLAELHPGLHYISSSADDVVSGHGPYQAVPVKAYFERAPTRFHSEMGMPNIVTLDSLRLMMPEAAMWPQGRMWGLHDFCLHGAQGGASFIERIRNSYGGAETVADWLELAQFVNYEGYRAMFEAQSRNRMGLLIWMSHPAWPSFVWQTYDYYFDPTAAYFGVKKASEPLHIQWNPVSDSVEVVNYSGGDARGLSAHVAILNLDGSLQWEKTATVDSAEDSTQTAMKLEYPATLTPVHFLRLELKRGTEVISENFYWRGLKDGDYRAIRDLPKVKLDASTSAKRQGDHWRLVTELHNGSKTPALMVRLKAVREKSGDRILPALYGDNYVSLMPGERRTIVTELQHVDTRGEQPRIAIEGFNLSDAAR